MSRYLSLSDDERRRMLAAIGKESTSDLFASIPKGIRLSSPLQIPGPLSEAEVLRFFRELAGRNAHSDNTACFLGAGAYHHFVPVIIDALISRSEFYTAYTPYQPEISQGTLQSIFEFQTLICQLTGLDVANASLYDGSTALAEAVLTAQRVSGRPEFLVSALVHPQYREVLETYTRNLDLRIRTMPYDGAGMTDLDAVRGALSDNTAAVVVQYPNFLGSIEDLGAAAQAAQRHGALLIVVVTEPVSLGLLQSPGALGADICVGEAQALGLPLSFGGPYVGFFACRDSLKRSMPGRIVGETVDTAGRRGFVLTLSTREQHIRREKATSNICTNEGLCALATAIFMCTMGKAGIRELALQNLSKARYAASELARAGCRIPFGSRFFNEFVVELAAPAQHVNARLAGRGIVGGYDLSRSFPTLERHMLLCVTEQSTRSQIDALVAELAGAAELAPSLPAESVLRVGSD